MLGCKSSRQCYSMEQILTLAVLKTSSLCSFSCVVEKWILGHTDPFVAKHSLCNPAPHRLDYGTRPRKDWSIGDDPHAQHHLVTAVVQDVFVTRSIPGVKVLLDTLARVREAAGSRQDRKQKKKRRRGNGMKQGPIWVS